MGGATAARTRLMRRSLLVTVPSFLAPGRGGQQQVGKVAGGGRGKGLLHHHKFGALQRAAHGGLVGHALRRVGAGDPQGLDFAIGGGLEHFDCGFPGFLWNA
jgi:hypothetical protein